MTNEEVLRIRESEKTRSMKVTIWRRKARWNGHIMKSEGMLRTVREGRADGKRNEVGYGRYERKARIPHPQKEVGLDREKWRTLVHTVS